MITTQSLAARLQPAALSEVEPAWIPTWVHDPDSDDPEAMYLATPPEGAGQAAWDAYWEEATRAEDEYLATLPPDPPMSPSDRQELMTQIAVALMRMGAAARAPASASSEFDRWVTEHYGPGADPDDSSTWSHPDRSVDPETIAEPAPPGDDPSAD